jgi:hypothetical protein
MTDGININNLALRTKVLTTLMDAIWKQESADLEIYPMADDPNPDAPSRPEVLQIEGEIDIGVLADAVAAATALHWQGMETAPKDGTEVLLFGPGVLISDGQSSVYARARHVGWWDGEFWSTRDPRVTCRAECWMALPHSPRHGGDGRLQPNQSGTETLHQSNPTDLISD